LAGDSFSGQVIEWPAFGAGYFAQFFPL